LKALIVCASLAIGFVLAQDSPPDPRTQNNQEQTPDSGPTSEQADVQPSELSAAGPSLLSRNKSAKARSGGKLLDFRFYAEITGVYDSGLNPVAANAQASTGTAAYGVETGFGFTVTRIWELDRLSAEYRGSYREYANSPIFNGSDQFLNLAYSHELQRRLTLDLKETAGTTTLANGEFAYLPITNADLFGVPTNELFDNRTIFGVAGGPDLG
jgi:hypothetical protein